MSQPLVSVTIPCYNAGPLLEWALASLLAQTYPEWEAIVVDDGSVDRPEAIVQAIDDSRIRLLRHEVNLGRAAARQTALDAARGAYVAKLDADDWLYPTKLARQVEILQAEPSIALVSSGIAIENEQGELVGVRAKGEPGDPRVQEPLRRLVSPPLAHAASMIRMDVAKRYRYRIGLQRSEDADFLLSVLMSNRFCVLPEVLYTYTEYRSAYRQALLDAYRYRMKMFWQHRHKHPAAALQRTLGSALKWGLYRAAFAIGQADALVARRSLPPSEAEIRAYEQAKSAVENAAERSFALEAAHVNRANL